MSLELQNTPFIFGNPLAFIVSCVFVCLTIYLLFALTGKIFLSGLLASIVLLTFYTVNFYRQMQTGQVLLPIDLHFIKLAKGIAAFSDISVHWRPVCSILCAAVSHIPLFFASKHIRVGVGKRTILFALSGLLIYLSFFTQYSQDTILSGFTVNASAGMSYNDIYREQGALLGFYAVGLADGAEEPEGYSRAYMEALATKVAASASESDSDCDSEKPNVIVIMSEAYWDPTKLPHIAFSEDPTPNLHRLSDKTTTGNVVPPSFGGMTCNTEFEFLTGNAMRFAGYGDVPYFESDPYIDRDNKRSLVSMFKANGYQTVALHTYSAAFFDRDQHYPKLGFSSFIAAEDLPEARTKGTLRGQEIISDEYFCDVLIEIMENAVDPLFLFGITMQNHTPYLPDKYENTHIQAESGAYLSEKDIEYIETYLEGVNDADKVLGRLYDYVMASDKPTILLYFGDHLPLLTQHTGVYTDLGYISQAELEDLSAEEAYKMYTTPYIAFCNYKTLPATWGDVSPYFLGAVLADAAGIQKNLYYIFLTQAFERFQAMNQSLFIADGELYSSPEEAEMTEMFAAFQYDKLFGERYVDDVMSQFP